VTVISVVPDQQAHTLTLTAQYAAPVEDVWQLWAAPRSWSAGGVRPRTRRPSSTTTFASAGAAGTS
jgi:uncharacterized protein YndB with AHSA1/START domain